jgi:hypothetical protein
MKRALLNTTAFYAFLTMIFLNGFAWAGSSTYYVHFKDGSNNNVGSLSKPWKTLAYSISKLQAGDTLYVRKAQYFEKNIIVNVKGTETNPIRIVNYKDERPIIDGGYRKFRSTANTDWELFDTDKKIYRSVESFRGAEFVQGFFKSERKLWRLVPYSDMGNLKSDNQHYGGSKAKWTIKQAFGPKRKKKLARQRRRLAQNNSKINDKIAYTYVGPGCYWNPADGRIYIRLEPSQQAQAMGLALPSLIDPRKVEIYLSSSQAICTFAPTSCHVEISGLELRFQNRALHFSTGSHHISIKNTRLSGGLAAVFIQRDVHHLLFDGLTIHDAFPPWIAWSDVKMGDRPAAKLKSGAINLQNNTHHIEIKNSIIHDLFDGIGLVHRSHDIHIHHNFFKGIRDDCVQIGSCSYNIEVNDNLMKGISKGVSWHGSGSPRFPGTKYIHHNVIDASLPMLNGRSDPHHQLPPKRRGPKGDGMTWYTPFGQHRGKGYGTGDPWKIYNNTVIYGQDLNNMGIGSYYRFEVFDNKIPHEVYNNIFIQIADHFHARKVNVNTGAQILDGNLYYRSDKATKSPIFSEWTCRSGLRNFASLNEFKKSACFRETQSYYAPGWENSGIEADPELDADYRPAAKGPAAKGTIKLPPLWPGTNAHQYRGAMSPTSKRVGPGSSMPVNDDDLE